MYGKQVTFFYSKAQQSNSPENDNVKQCIVLFWENFRKNGEFGTEESLMNLRWNTLYCLTQSENGEMKQRRKRVIDCLANDEMNRLKVDRQLPNSSRLFGRQKHRIVARNKRQGHNQRPANSTHYPYQTRTAENVSNTNSVRLWRAKTRWLSHLSQR